MMPDLSIIIINYKTPQLTINCLQTIYDQTSNIILEVIVVDNASGDGNRDIVCGRFPQIKWVQMDYNAGFARANNEGIRQSSGDIVLLLNSDTLNEDNAIERCYLAFRDGTYVACGVQLLNSDRTPQISGNYFMKGSLNHLLPLPYIGSLVKLMGNLVRVKKPNIPSTDSAVEVDWINGAFLMVKKHVIDKAGLMDEDFFLYAEEAEWCSRINAFGKLAIFGQFKVIHLQGFSANQTFGSAGQGYYNLYDRKGLQIMLSNFVRIRKQFGVSWYLFHLVSYTLTIPIFFIVGIFHNLFTFRNLFRHFSDAGGFAKNVVRLWRYLPIIISRKPHFYKVL